MANKQSFKVVIDGMDLAVSVFDKTESSEAGLCCVRLEAHQAGAHFYCKPAELAEIGRKLIYAAKYAAKVEESGVL